jgi:hypothetical protein
MKRERKNYEHFNEDLIALIRAEAPELADDLCREMIYNVAQVREEKFDIAELRLLNTAFKELRYALKVFKPYRDVPKAAVFGSARTPKDHSSFALAENFGAALAKKGWMIITGGASGIMEAAMVGAGAENSFGLNIMLPFEQSANPVILGDGKLVFFKYFFTRKLMFLKESAATVLFPGGWGTFDEGFESMTLVQTGKARPRPIVMIDPPHSRFWKTLLSLMKENLEGDKLISHQDLSLITHCQDIDKAVEELTRFYSNYDSSRFLRDSYLIRVRRPVTKGLLATLNRDFRDILAQGDFEALQDVSEDDNQDPALHRIIFHFDKTGYARLHQLINTLNNVY